MEQSICPLCGGARFAAWRYGLLRCENCKLVVDRAIWRSAVNAEMEEEYFGERYRPSLTFWVRYFEAIKNRRVVRRLNRYEASSGKLLEVGVGSGSFLAFAKRQGFAPVGCDVSRTICERVRRSTGISMHCGPLESMSSKHEFDVVVMNHVLEHVDDPRTLLAGAFRLLKPGGLLHVAVPNAAAWEATLPGWISYERYHLSYFTPSTLRALAEKAGFEVLRLGTHESFSGWFLAILRTLLGHRPSRHRRANTGIGTSKSRLRNCYYLAMATSGLLTLPIRWAQAALGFGDEVILLARSARDGV